MAGSNNHRDPELPMFVRVVTGIDIVLSLARLGFVFLLNAQLDLVPQGAQYLVLTSMALNAAILVCGVAGGLATLAHKRYGPVVQGLSMFLVVATLAMGVMLNLGAAGPQADRDAALLAIVMVGAATVTWVGVMYVSISKASNLFHFMDSARILTVGNLQEFSPGVGFQVLDFAGNRHVKDKFCRLLAAHRGIQRLDLSGTAITDEAAQYLAELPRLVRLDLSGTEVTDAIFPVLAQAPSLLELRVAETGCTPAAARGFESSVGSQRTSGAPVRVSFETEPLPDGVEDL